MARALLLAALACAALLLAAPAQAARVLTGNTGQITNRQNALQNLASASIFRAVRGSQATSAVNSQVNSATAAVTVSSIPLYYVQNGQTDAYFGTGN